MLQNSFNVFRLSKILTIAFTVLATSLFPFFSYAGSDACKVFYSSGKSCSDCASFTLRLTPDSWALLSPRWEHNQQMISQVVKGSGEAYLVTPSEFASSLKFAPHTQKRIKDYMGSALRHRAAFLLLPETAHLIENTIASTYPDNPTRSVTFSKDQKWLVTNLRQLPDQPAQHLVIMSHQADAFTALHEVKHLEDFDAVYNYAEAKGSSYLLRMDVFTVLSELHAYQAQFRMIDTENPSNRIAAADGLANDLKNQVGPMFAGMNGEMRTKLQKITGLNGQDFKDYRAYLTEGPTFLSWSEILPKLNPEVFKEYIP